MCLEHCLLCSTLCPAVWPSNLQYINHFNEFLYHGYRPAIGTVEVRFPKRDATRTIQQGTVGISDGQTKIIIMAAIIGMIVELELEDHPDLKDAGSALSKTLETFVAIRCSYIEFVNPSHHFLHSLRVLSEKFQFVNLSLFVVQTSCDFSRKHLEMGFVSAEKISPSPISILADIQGAIEVEKSLGRGRMALRDMLGRVASDFNKMIVTKKHRIDSGRKTLLLNLFLVSQHRCVLQVLCCPVVVAVSFIGSSLGFVFPAKHRTYWLHITMCTNMMYQAGQYEFYSV